jgi:hypothetical protein
MQKVLTAFEGNSQLWPSILSRGTGCGDRGNSHKTRRECRKFFALKSLTQSTVDRHDDNIMNTNMILAMTKSRRILLTKPKIIAQIKKHRTYNY